MPWRRKCGRLRVCHDDEDEDKEGDEDEEDEEDDEEYGMGETLT